MAAAVGTDSLVHAELLAACSSLGYSDGAHYHREADCLETTKDLLRYLRRDDDTHEVRLALGDTRVLQTDLLPLLQEHGSDEELLQLLVRLLVDLTNPALLLFREELPEEKVTRRKFLQLVTQQQEFKEAFTKQGAWEALAGRVGQLLEVPPEERDEDQRLLLERILVLVRNVLSAPASADEGRTDDDASTHDQVLWAMHMGGLADLLLYLATTPAEHLLALHVLEVVSLMLREQDAAKLATTGLGASDQERQAENRQLEELRRREALQRESQRRAAPSRHSRFGGTYVVRNVKGVGENDLILHQPCADGSQRSFDRHKRPKKYSKNRVPLKQTDTTRRSTLAVRLFLQEFCVEFLAGAYNSIMAAVKDALDRARAQDHDETYYLWAMRFFMEFNRHHTFRLEYVTETLSIHTFHFIQTHIENFFEMMVAEKKKVALWSRRMHRALRAYQELLATLAHMDRSPSPEVRESSRVLKSRVFYVVEYREMMLLLLQNYDPIKMSLSYLRDAVEATHTFLKLLEGFCGRGRHIIVQGKARRAAQRKAKAAKAAAATAELTPQQLQEQWDAASLEVSAVVQGEGGELPLMVPFDPLSEEPEDTQKEMAMRRISQHLRDKEYPQAVALLRAAREVWPEGDVFGPQAADHTQDFLTLQEVFMANLTPPQGTPAPEEVNEEEELEEEDEEEEERMAVMTEQEFDFDAFIRRFANTKVIRAYSRLLHHYPTNTTHTNHCILKLFHRLAWDVKLPAIFFQASLFIVFLRAVEDPLRTTLESPREIAKFAKYIMRQLYKVAETNPKVFVEMLFWKTNKDALEIECGYGEQESGKQAAKQAWREEEEEELRRLYEEVTQIPEDERDGKDTVDLILDRLISRSRTRRSVIKKLKELGLIQNIRDIQQKAPRIRAPRTWTEEEEEELRALFRENREAMDVVGRVMDGLSIRRPKHRVVEKILELGLVADRKELRKKRPKNPNARRPGKTSGEDFLRANEDGEDEDDDIDESDSDEEVDGGDDDEGNDRQGGAGGRRPPPPPPADPIATPALISQALGVVLEAGRREAVEWLAGILNDVADDREEDGDFEPVPILAITQTCTDAMEDDGFQKLLRLLGLRPPLSHQEMFWRLPSSLSVAALRKRAEYLRQGVEGGLLTLENPDEPLEPVEEVEDDAATKGKKAKKSKDKMKKKRERKAAADVDSPVAGDEGDGDDYPPSPSSSSSSAPKTKALLAGKKKTERKVKKEESSVDIPSSHGPSTSSPVTMGGDSSEDEAPLSSLAARPDPSPARKGGKRALSEEESNDDGEVIKRKKEKKKKKKRIVLDSDSEKEEEEEEEDMEGEATKTPREEEEEEEEEVISQATKKQRIRAVIISDDEDD